MPSSITVLSLPVVKKKLLTSVEIVQQRLDQLRKSRFLRRASQKRIVRNAVTQATDAVSRSASTTVQRVSKILRGLFKPSKRVSGVAQYAGGVMRKLLLAVGRTARQLSTLPGIRTIVKKLRSLRSANLLPIGFTKQGKDKRQRRLRGAFLSAAFCGILKARVRKRRVQGITRSLAPQTAAAFVDNLFGPNMVSRVLALRQQAYQSACVATIQRAWARWKARQEDLGRRKVGLLRLMADAQSHLHLAEENLRVTLSVTQRVAASAVATVGHGLKRRCAVRLIQRVWRGSRARLRVFNMLSDKKRRAYLKLQLQRVRRAKEALLAKTPLQAAEQRALAKRLAARMEPTPLKNPRVARIGGALTRTSMRQPLTHQSSPPLVSAVTGARVLPVAFAKYEKIRTTHARVNPLNLWVAIPVGYNEVLTEDEKHSHQKERAAGRVHGFLKAKFDWVPATLLTPQPDIEKPPTTKELRSRV